MKAAKKLLLPMLTVQAIAGLLTPATALAAPAGPTRFIWSDRQGFVSASLCRESLRHEIPFAILDNSKPLQVGKQLVSGRALVTRRGQLKSPGYEWIDLIDKKAQGYVKPAAFSDLTDYVLEIKNEKQILQAGTARIKIDGSFWQAAMSDDQFKTIDCGSGADKKNYTLFEVFTAESLDPLATVGVSTDEVKIFQKLTIDSADEAEAKIGGPDALDATGESTVSAGKALSLGKSEQGTQLLVQTLTGGVTFATVNPKAATTKTAGAAAPATPKAAGVLAPATTGAMPAIGASVAAPAASDAKVNLENKAEQSVVDGVPVVNSLDYVVCSENKGLRVRDQSLQKVLFTVDGLDEVRLVQSWGVDKQEATIDGKKWTFVKVQVPDEEDTNEVGWIASDFIKEKSKCELVKKEAQVVDKINPVDPALSITGLNDKNCCTFPTMKRPTDSYKTGMRRFGANRARGRRTHAASDLYRKHGEAFVAIAKGTVIRDRYMFYQGVYALEVVHEGGFVVRYGEILSRTLPGVRKGQRVKAGQTLGYIGTVNSGCCNPMLHFEVYSGRAKGALTQLRRRPTQRRADVINPTSYLSTWEKRQFGTSY